jgi:hypothetical protein
MNMRNEISSQQICRVICEYDYVTIRNFLTYLESSLEESALERLDRDQGFLEAERFVLQCDEILSVIEKIFDEREKKAQSDDAGTSKST